MARKKPGTDMMSPEQMEEQMRAYAEQEYVGEHGGGGGANIGIKGWEFKLNGEDLGDEIDVVVVATAYEQAYYDSPYDKDDPQPPACFAIGATDEELAPDPSSPAPQCDTTCADCWAYEWGSSPTGSGKACKSSRRLALLAVGEDGVVFDEMPTLKIPPTSLKHYSGYAKRSTKISGRPTFGLITKIGFADNSDHEELAFSLVGKVEDPEQMNQILTESRPAAEELVLQPFDVSNYKDPEELKSSRRSTKRKPAAKKKVAKKAAAKRGGSRSKMS